MIEMPTIFFGVRIDENLEREFRDVAGEVLGLRRGALREAVEEALKDWISKKKKTP